MSTRVSTQYGTLEGEARASHLVFRGIPFARPPVGALRFRAPLAPEAWRGVRAAREFSASAMQAQSAVPGVSAEGPLSEDCLYLNVYTPGADGRRRPVLFWIHGGAFTAGAGSMDIYDGGPLAERGDAVVVTINYRLGALGYAYLGAHGGERIGASANCGQLDQIAALRWVRDNIANFGGDPNNVTLFGESAGSMAVCTLLITPAARGLFHRAVAQSGASLRMMNTEHAAKATDSLFDKLGVARGDVEALRDVPAERIVSVQAAFGMGEGLGRGFAPMVDGAVIPAQPIDAIERGDSAEVPLVIGTTRDELNLFIMPLLREADTPVDEAQVIEGVSRTVPKHARDRLPGVVAAYRAARAARDLPHGTRALIAAIQTDAQFRIPSIRFAEAYRARQANTFMYLFTYESPAMRGALRACHALEIPFVFGTLDKPYQDRFAGKGPAAEALSAVMMDAWLAFAKAGNPSTDRADWVPYDQQRRATMVFDKVSGLEDDPYREERAAWDGIA
jgi:para-nitrobenzyl esterase